MSWRTFFLQGPIASHWTEFVRRVSKHNLQKLVKTRPLNLVRTRSSAPACLAAYNW